MQKASKIEEDEWNKFSIVCFGFDADLRLEGEGIAPGAEVHNKID